MITHKMLQQLLEKLHINENSVPKSLKLWQQFLRSIDQAYINYDHDVVNYKHAMRLASDEFLTLSNHLENAQYIGRMGYWNYNHDQNRFDLSKGFYSLLGLSHTDIIPHYDYLLSIVHELDNSKLRQCIDYALTNENNRSECEIRMKHSDGNFTWYNVICCAQSSSIQDNIKSLFGIIYDISEYKQAQQEIAALHEQLMNTARQAGKTEIVVSMLHNVGNVLNSANVSISLLRESISKPHMNKFTAVAQLLMDHKQDMISYLTTDNKGKLIPEYIIKLSQSMQHEHQICRQETDNIHEYIQHIKEIIVLQSSHHHTVDVSESVSFPAIILKSLQMSGLDFDQLGINITVQHDEELTINCNRSSLLQILVNLIKNATEAVMTNDVEKLREITLFFNAHEKKSLIIHIHDNGVGIDSQNINKIFSFGFTTKKQGHGYGLHDCALKAKEMKGSLTAASQGLGLGTTFTLTLPLNSKLS